MRKQRIKSTVPVYLAAMVWVLYGLLLPLYRLTDILIAAAISVICYLLANKIFRGEEIELPEKIVMTKTGSEDADRMIKQGLAYMERLDRLNIAIADEDISAQIVRLKETARSIFKFIAQDPASARKLDKFMDYYFPSCISLLENYSSLAASAPPGQALSETNQKIRGGLDGIERVFAKQLQSLYDYRMLDISADIDVLNNMLAAEGLGGSKTARKQQ